jgi:hypothetical protein
VAKRKSEGDFAVPNELWRALGPRKGSRGKLHASDGFPWGFWFLYLIYIYIIFLQKEKQITRKAHAYAAIFAVA